MRASTREARLLETIVMLADTLVAGYDVVELLQSLVERSSALLDSTAAGILLTTGSGRLQIVASTDDSIELLEALQLSGESGPCATCVREGRAVSIPDIATGDDWPEFRRTTVESGYRAVHAVPLRLRETTIGAFNLFRERSGSLDGADAMAAQALADVATIGILQERAIHEADIARAQLQRALDSRVTIEQAKGVVAYRNDIDMAAAFDLIRQYARQNRLGISEVADQIVQRTLPL